MKQYNQHIERNTNSILLLPSLCPMLLLHITSFVRFQRCITSLYRPKFLVVSTPSKHTGSNDTNGDVQKFGYNWAEF